MFFARSAVRHPRRITGNWSAGLRPASRGSAKPAPTTPRHGRNSQFPVAGFHGRIRERAAASSDASLPFCERGESPLSHFPPELAGSERSSLPFVFFAHSRSTPPTQNHGDDMERRSPTGIARERETCTDDAAPRQSHGCEPTHRQPRRITGTWSAGLRPASRGSAKPAPTTPPPTNLTAWSAGLRPASRGSAKPAPTTPRHANLTARSAGLRPASRGSAKPAPTTLRHANLTAANPRIADREESRGRPWSAGLRPASRGSAKPAPTTLRLPALGAHPGSTTDC